MTEPEGKLPSVNSYLVAFFATCVGFAILLSSAEIPPITDLPQHLAQIRLFNELIGLENTVFNRENYQINWFAPNTLVYLPLWLMSFVFEPITSGKVLVLILCVLWSGSIFWLAYKRNLHIAHAVLACSFVLNMSLYWGFISFLLGFPIFSLWLLIVGPDCCPVMTIRRSLSIAIISVLLLLAHSLWFALAVFWYGCSVTYNLGCGKISFVEGFRQILPLLPAAIFAILWIPGLSDSLANFGFRVTPSWGSQPWERLSLSEISGSVFGGLGGDIDAIVILIVGGWLVFSAYSNREGFFKCVDSRLLYCAILFWVVYLFAPYYYMNTIFFSNRWASVAAIFTVLAFPAVRNVRKIFNTIPVAVFGALLLATFLVWKTYSVAELGGYKKSFAMIPNGSKVMWLSYSQSPRFKHYPFLQIGAYSQALSGSELNFTFAELQTGIVTMKNPRHINWTRNLEWYPTLVQKRDFSRFDYILVKASRQDQEQFSKRFNLVALTVPDSFTLYSSATQPKL